MIPGTVFGRRPVVAVIEPGGEKAVADVVWMPSECSPDEWVAGCVQERGVWR